MSRHSSSTSPSSSEPTPVMFLHGFMGRAGDWMQLRTGLKTTTLAIDLPGHGTPGLGLSGAWFDATSELIAASLDESNISKAHLVGYSMGGRIALHFAKRFPTRVSKIVLESSHPGLKSETERKARLQHDAKWASLIQSEWPGILHEWYQQSVFASLKEHIPELVASKIQHDPNQLASALMGFSLGLQESFWSLDHDVLFIAGQLDPKYAQIGSELSGISSKTALFLVDHAGHNVHLEQPDPYLRAIANFLELDLR